MKFHIILFALLVSAGTAWSQSSNAQTEKSGNHWYQKAFNKKKNFSIKLDNTYKLVDKLNPTEIVV